MTSFKDPEVRRELVMKHYSSPTNKLHPLEVDVVDVFSNQCVDKLHLHLDINNGIIEDTKWDGMGCAVFQSSTDIFLDLIKGKTIEEAKKINSEYEKLINGNHANEDILKELVIFDNVGKQLNRLHCAEMIVRGIKKAL